MKCFRRPTNISELAILAEELGFQLDQDNEGQIVFYTGLWYKDEDGNLQEDPRFDNQGKLLK